MSNKNLAYYMHLPYRVEIYPEDDASGYTATIPALPGCMTCAETLAELWELIENAKQLWIEAALEEDSYIPEPAPVKVEKHSGRFVVRIPKSLHRQLAQRAEQENTSLNQLTVMLLAEGMGRWTKPIYVPDWPQPAAWTDQAVTDSPLIEAKL